MVALVILGIVVVIILYLVFLYNTIVRNKNETEKAFGTIDAMLKKRYDLLPNLVEIVKQYMLHEASVLSDITRLRSLLTDNLSVDNKIELHNDIAKRLSNFVLTVENYPDLKANQSFLKLQASWNETEEQIAAARRYYNTTITNYNNSIQTFPANFIAANFGFSTKKIFEIAENERSNVSAKELFAN
jgi:LemA protein